MLAEKLIDFIDRSPSTFHVIDNFKSMLLEVGFVELFENEAWNIKAGGKYFVIRNGSAIISFCVPEDEAKNFKIIASHSDSPSFKIKPNPEYVVDGKYLMLNTEKYGGMIMSTWFDKPLSVAGRVTVSTDNGVETKLVNLADETVMIPNLAIHMDRNINDGYKYNAQKDLIPLFGMGDDAGAFDKKIAANIGVAADKICATDLFLYNKEKGVIWGTDNELISAPKLDDLECAYMSIYAIANAKARGSVLMSAIFDNEEVGSGSYQGADSDFLVSVVDRIANKLGFDAETKSMALADSFLISADNAHAVHPNYKEKADPTNKPYINDGIVIKENASRKYTSDSVSEAIFKKICEACDVPFQTYVNRSDIAGGSTLGNISMSHISINSVDIGLPQLAMHSSYETAGAKDLEYMGKAFEKFFEVVIKREKNGHVLVATND